MPSSPAIVKTTQDGLTVVGYRGVGAALLAFDLPKDKVNGLAGFAVDRTDPKGKKQPLLNRISFEHPLTSEDGPAERRWTDTHQAPFQYFRWVDIPPDVVDGTYEYTVTARYFKREDPVELRDGPSAKIKLPLLVDDWRNFKLGFTRGYLSSQAYGDHFHDDQGKPLDFRARPETLDYDTAPYERQYRWLGFTGRHLLFDFLRDCVRDKNCSVDMFAYDFDEPDMLKLLEELGPRLRAYLDVADLHTKPGALELTVRERLEKSAGKKNVHASSFTRFAHCKVLIKKGKDGQATKVLAGSANFSVRGLYVQANNIFVSSNRQVAGLYEDAFDQAFNHPGSEFKSSPIAAKWQEVAASGIPTASYCFSPHKDGNQSLGPVGMAIDDASTSVFYAVMQFGGGAVTEAIQKLPNRSDVFTMGVIDQSSKAVVFSPSSPNGTQIPFAYLHGQVPWPFKEELGRDAPGGEDQIGKIIHDKFVVVDFNGEDPQVFFGSSNLAKGGEQDNSDSLVACKDPLVVTSFAVEAVRNIDHFHFRSALHNATKPKPLVLHTGKWWDWYYDTSNLKCRDRELFAHPAKAD
jgi:phosphatidylserine/phosphatidylglycerophosphate/cardiolipin synthase-like enzyme